MKAAVRTLVPAPSDAEADVVVLRRRVRELEQQLARLSSRAAQLGFDIADVSTETPLTGAQLRVMRRMRGWSQYRLINELQRVALRRGVHLPDRTTLRIYVSRWENGRARPSRWYADLLLAALRPDPIGDR